MIIMERALQARSTGSVLHVLPRSANVNDVSRALQNTMTGVFFHDRPATMSEHKKRSNKETCECCSSEIRYFV